MMRPPPHILYPGMVLGLLAMSLTTSFAILFFASSDGGPQIERDYYERSVNWDADQQARGTAERLGWLVHLEPSGSLQVMGPEERPVLGLAGTVVTRRPSLSEPAATSPLEATPGRPGFYGFESGVDGPGLWDFGILAMSPGGESVLIEIRREIP